MMMTSRLTALVLFAFPFQVSGLRQTVNAVSLSVREHMGPITRALAEKQPMIDLTNDNFTPRLASDVYERVPELGIVKLGPNIGRTASTMVFSLESHPEYVIKYKTNCETAEGAVHPLLMDFWLSDRASRVDVAPRAVFVSPAALLDGATSIKVRFAITDEKAEECADKHAVVRFMIVERVGKSLESYSGTSDMRASLAAGVQLIDLLTRLHKVGIFHGDIHPGNVCESLRHEGKLLLIDFELGGFVESESDEPLGSPMPIHHVLTEWQLIGLPFSRRDDIYKTLELIGSLAVGGGFWARPHEWVSSGETDALLAWKRVGSPFKTDSDDPIERLVHSPVDEREWIDKALQGIVDLVRGLVSVTTPIPYEEIIEQLSTVLFIVTEV